VVVVGVGVALLSGVDFGRGDEELFGEEVKGFVGLVSSCDVVDFALFLYDFAIRHVFLVCKDEYLLL
jgi:hypothetical protein